MSHVTPNDEAPTPDARHFESLQKQAQAVEIGIGVLLASEILLFGAILALVAAYRVTSTAAFAEGIRHADKTLGSINTAVLLVSSTFVAIGITRARAGKHKSAGGLVLSAAAMGCIFITIKVIEYAQHIAKGIVPNGGPGIGGAHTFWALYYLATGLHGIHVAVGVVALSIVGVRLLRHDAVRRPLHSLDAVGLYWHFVDMVWLFLWPLFYLV